jgi:uncharacterized membrane protein
MRINHESWLKALSDDVSMLNAKQWRMRAELQAIQIILAAVVVATAIVAIYACSH